MSGIRVKIVGAGSAGNHLAFAARSLAWDVLVCDVDRAALSRMKGDIYPNRYGTWDDSIELVTVGDAPKGGFDAIFIAAPPDHHVPLAIEAISEGPKVVLIEKPLCPPTLARLDELDRRRLDEGVTIFVGYDHTVGRAARVAERLLDEDAIGAPLTMDVEFREHWAGIFAAHPWLSGPEDSYLGSWRRGGGAGGEHSHGINLWQHFAHVIGAGRVTRVGAHVSYEARRDSEFDTAWFAHFETETGFAGRVAQDVITRPPRKRAVLQGTEGTLEWVCGYSERGDAVLVHRPGKQKHVEEVAKSRTDDFLEEVRVIEAHLAGELKADLAFETACETMLTLAAGHESQRVGATISIDYDHGYTLEALSPSSA